MEYPLASKLLLPLRLLMSQKKVAALCAKLIGFRNIVLDLGCCKLTADSNVIAA